MSELKKKKYVIVIDHELSVGLMANTAAVLSSSIGRLAQEIIGPDLHDRSGATHLGIVTIPIAILKADQLRIKQIRDEAAQADSLVLVDFCNVAQVSKTYDDYRARLSNTPVDKLHYLGIALFGNAKEVARLTGNLGLMR